MGIFSSIKSAIFGESEEQTKEPTPAPVEPTRAPTTPRTEPISKVDVAERLDRMPASDKLNWRTSIVDLMKLVGIDPSFENRKELAGEMGDANYSGKAEENIWLHKAVMRRMAESGGKVPEDLKA
ncbi:MAG: DUF3597 domain-containing protein [Erythrobacter sp.]|jgi:hypothetical protein|nr:DUF3597 domain-containing protein [Erythrobacter sp.]